MTVTNDTIHALRVGDLLIDSETGEILSEENLSIDDLCFYLKDGQENEKAWKAYNGALKSAVGKKLKDEGVLRALTPSGSPMLRRRTDRTAKADTLDDLAESLGLSDSDKLAILECASSLDVKQLEGLRRIVSDQVDAAILELIQEKTIEYVQLMPLRRAAPVVEAVELQREDYPNA